MSDTALVSIFGPDRVGLISAVTGRLFDLGINLGDTTFAVLGEGAEFVAICHLPGGITFETLRTELASLEELSESRIEIAPFEMDPIRKPSAQITHRIVCEGPDQPGLLARMSEALTEFGANIVRINAKQTRGGRHRHYDIRLAVCIPADKEAACLATLRNTANQLGQTFESETASPAP